MSANNVPKLLQLIEFKVKKSDPIDDTSPKDSDLQDLLALCSSTESQVASSACHGLVWLVKKGLVHFQLALDTFILIAATAGNVSPAVRGITSLLRLQTSLHQGQGRYVNPYKIRSPPHPYITVLCNRAETWVAVYDEVVLILTGQYPSLRGCEVAMLDPCLRYILLEPVSKHRLLRIHLLKAIGGIISADKSPVCSELRTMILTILPAMPISDSASLLSVCEFLRGLLSECRDDEFRRTVALELLSLCPVMARTGVDLTLVLDELTLLAKTSNQYLSATEVVPVLRHLILDAPLHHLSRLLELAVVAIPVSECPRVLTPCLLYTLTHYTSLCVDPSLTVRAQILQCLKALDSQQITNEKTNNENHCELMINPDVYTYRCLVKLTTMLLNNNDLAYYWLDEVVTSPPLTNQRMIADVLATLMIGSSDDDVIVEMALKALIKMAEMCSDLSGYLLPVILFKLKRETREKTRLVLLNALPQLATNKVVVGAILRTIQSLSKNRSLRPLALRLMCALWRRQDRCYQYLLRMLSEDSASVGQSTELTIAKAATIRDICQIRASQHGQDMLPLISSVLNSSANQDEALAAALALEALYWLCENDVIDLRATWTVMADRLSNDNRPLVLCKVCELFSLAPRLKKETEEYQLFLAECVRYLWCLSQCGVTMVQKAAFMALAEFQVSTFTPAHLPEQVLEGLSVEEGNPLPGDVYIKLLHHLAEEMRHDYEPLLTSLLRQELDEIPRSVHTSTVRRRGINDKSLNSVPSTVQNLYNRCDNPGLRPSLTVGLLYCYDPPVAVGRDGRPRSHHYTAHGKAYHQMLNTLLLEVPLDPVSGYGSLTLAQAWRGFMERLYQASLEARRADINLQLRQGKCSDSQADENQRLAWIWVRDEITETLKSASRGSINMQSNGLLALSALVGVVNDHVTRQEVDACADHGVYQSPAHWTMTMAETVMGVIDVNFIPSTTIIPWGQTGSSASASTLVQCSACLCLPMLLPVLLSQQEALLRTFLTKLASRVQGRRMPPPLAQCYGQALGSSLSTVYQNSRQCRDFADDALKLLEKASFDTTSKNNRNGNIIGLGYAASALCCTESESDGRARALQILDRLMTEVTSQMGENGEAQCLSVSVIAAAAYSVNAVTGDRVAAIADQLFQVHLSNKQRPGVAMALGLLCCQMKRQGLTLAAGIYKALSATWTKQLDDADVTVAERTACLYGLYGLAGAIPHPVMSLSDPGPMEPEVSNLVKLSVKATSGSETSLKPVHVQYLSLLYSVQTTGGLCTNIVPLTYDYLGESSVLRAVYQELINSLERKDVATLSLLLRAVVAGCSLAGDDETSPHRQLPPCDWSGLLSTVIKSQADSATKVSVFGLVIGQVDKSPLLAGFLSTWMKPPLFDTLPADCWCVLYESVGVLCKKLSPASMAAFLNGPCLRPFIPSSRDDARLRTAAMDARLRTAVLHGMKEGVRDAAVPDVLLPEFTKALKTIYKTLNQDTEASIFSDLARCLSYLSDDVIDDVTMLDFTAPPDGVSYRQGMSVRAWLVAEGGQPIGLLNPSVDAFIHDHDAHDISVLTRCWARVGQQPATVQARLQWFTEFLGHMYNSCKEASPKMVTTCLRLFCAVVRAWAGHDVVMTSLTSDDVTVTSQCLVEMVTSQAWREMGDKIITWMTSMAVLAGGKDLNACLYAARHCEHYKKAKHWTMITSLL